MVIEKGRKKNALVIISQRYENDGAMRKLLLWAGFQNMVSSIAQCTSALTEELQRYRESVLGPMWLAARSLENIQAGAKLADTKICDLTDDNGENISEKNPYKGGCGITSTFRVAS